MFRATRVAYRNRVPSRCGIGPLPPLGARGAGVAIDRTPPSGPGDAKSAASGVADSVLGLWNCDEQDGTGGGALILGLGGRVEGVVLHESGRARACVGSWRESISGGLEVLLDCPRLSGAGFKKLTLEFPLATGDAVPVHSGRREA